MRFKDGYDPDMGWDTRDVDTMEADAARQAELARRTDSPMPVTTRIRMIRQPRGGYLPVSKFQRIDLGDTTPLREGEDVRASTMGLAVDYLSRVAGGDDVESAFDTPLFGARLAGEYGRALELAEAIQGFDDDSISAAVLLCSYDVAGRRGVRYFRGARRKPPSPDTIWNIRRMVARTLSFLSEYGPIVWDAFSFEGGYTDLITCGDGDFLTKDTLWDMKTSMHEPSSAYTLQLLVYWRMGLHSVHPVYRDMTRLGLFNPRLDVAYLLDVADIPDDVIHTVEHEVIGYEDDA
ncbi:hypothetical protein [Bifidobacterium rousetti]|uniref:hypothetical protein n=1 Tax=Bifidobacterium rousetti TaxID=2045439 RepID=UPI001238D5B4|nr:hypothetical protein [Bifidobacterium rousetti]